MLAKPNEKRNDTANAKSTRFKQKTATLNYDGRFNILLKNRNCAESLNTLRENIHKTKKYFPFKPRSALYSDK